MHADGLLDILNVITRGLRQILILADAGDIAAPARQVFHNGLCFFQHGREGEFVGDLAVDLIGGADGNLVHVAEDIQLGQRDIRRALYLHAIACGHQVNGAYPAGAARLGAILRAGLPQLFRVGTEPLAGEGAFAHAGGVGLDHAHNLVQLGRRQTGTKIPSLVHLLTSVWFYIILFCFIGVVILLYYLRKTLFFYERVKGFVLNIWEGIMSLKGVRNIPLFIFYTLAIWACYFLHFYFTFYCFAFTAHLGILAALVMFVGGTFAVIVPTPNGAGPWHFAIISMMMLYGVNETDAGIFALIVHGIQTFLVVLLGVYGLAALSLTNRQRK